MIKNCVQESTRTRNVIEETPVAGSTGAGSYCFPFQWRARSVSPP